MTKKVTLTYTISEDTASRYWPEAILKENSQHLKLVVPYM